MNYKDNKLNEYLILENIKVLKSFKDRDPYEIQLMLNFFLGSLDSLVFFEYSQIVYSYVVDLKDYLFCLKDDSVIYKKLYQQSYVLLNRLDNNMLNSSFISKSFSQIDWSLHSSDQAQILLFLHYNFAYFDFDLYYEDFVEFWESRPSLSLLESVVQFLKDFIY